MSQKKRGIMLKSLTLEDEGMQELINPVPLEVATDTLEQVELDSETEAEVEELVAMENEAIQEVIDMLEDTAEMLEKTPKT